MATPKRMVLDLSHHNVVSDWDAMVAAPIYGIIHKASEGDYMTDDKYGGRRKGCKESGLLWGAYHFATNDPVKDQVDLFMAAARPDQDTLMCLDWEPYGSKQMSVEQAREFIERLEELLGRPNGVVIYSGNLAKEELHGKDAFFGARRLWLAQYGTNPTVQESWKKYWLWQYSDGEVGPEPKGCPGVSGGVDTNHYDGTVDELRAQWSGGDAPMPAPDDEQVVKIEIEAPEGVRVDVTMVDPQPGD